jgi:predicted  nucleic acid-binding Zn-ribbon protein
MENKEFLSYWGDKMKTLEMDIFLKYKKEIEELKSANAELKELNRDLEERLQELHGEYMLLRYQLSGMPTNTEILKLRQELQALQKELRMRGWHNTSAFI